MNARQGFENERKWLQHLALAKNEEKGTESKILALVGFEKSEAEYLVELAKERLKSLGIELPSQAEVMNQASLEKLRCYQYSLFDKAPFGLYEMSQLSAGEQKEWAQAFVRADLGVLLIVSGKLDACWKPFIKTGAVLDVSDEKPWHRQDRICEWFRAFLKHKGLEISLALATEVVQAYGMDRRSLKTQAQTWADEKGYQGSLVPEDLNLDPSYTVWKLLDDLWQSQTGKALLKLSSLLKEEPSGVSLSALLRQQWSALGNCFENAQGASSGHKKNLEAFAARLGFTKWKEGLRKIHKAQLDLRSSMPPQSTLERLLIELTQL